MPGTAPPLRGSDSGAGHIVPVAGGPRATPVSRSGPFRLLLPRAPRPPMLSGTRFLGGPEPARAADPHPDWGSRILRDNSLILVITGVEAGDRSPSRRSVPDRACWPAVGSERLPVVDTWTTRRLCTGSPSRPPSLPCAPTAGTQVLWVATGHDRCLGRRSGGLSGVRAGQWRNRCPTAYRRRRECNSPSTSRAVTRQAPVRPQSVHIPGDNSSTSRPGMGW